MKQLSISITLLLVAITSFSQNTPPNQPAASPVNPTSQPAEFKNMRTFIQNGTLQLPAGTTRIMIEAWGGGGGGSNTGGGGGGAYGKTTVSVLDGSAITVVVGAGGKGGTLQAASGGATNVQYKPNAAATGVVFTVAGGVSAGYIVGMGGAADQGNGGAGAYSNSSAGYYSICGQDGETYTDQYQQSGTNTYAVTRSIGKGGNAGNTQYTGGRGDVVLNPSSPGYKRYGTEGKAPGGGGGGSINPIGGYKGAAGMVIIYY
jgi:hypothetical protein